MSLGRFALYFVAVMACGVAAFPHWAPASDAASLSPLGGGTMEIVPARHAILKSSLSEHHRGVEPLRQVAHL